MGQHSFSPALAQNITDVEKFEVGKKLTGWGKNWLVIFFSRGKKWLVSFFPEEEMGRPDPSPGKDWRGGKNWPLHRVNAGLVILRKYTPVKFTLIKSRAMTLSRSPQCRAFSRALMDEKSLSPLFPVGYKWLVHNFDNICLILFIFTPHHYHQTMHVWKENRGWRISITRVTPLCNSYSKMFVLWLIVHTLWNQLLVLSLDLFNTLQICYRHIEDVHEEAWCWKKYFLTNLQGF